MRKFCVVTVLLLLLVPIIGCAGITVTDAHRGLTLQNKDAATQLLQFPGLPPGTAQILMDISANCSSQLASWGAPTDKTIPTIYTQKNSQDLRDRSKKEDESDPWWKFPLTLFASTLLGGGVFYRLAAMFPNVFGGTLGVVVNALITGISKVRTAAASGPITEATVKETVAAVQQTAGVQPLVDKLKEKVEAKLAKIIKPKA